MKIRFLGVPGEKLDEINAYGTTFPLGKWVDVEEKEANRDALHKLPRHPHFEVADREKALELAAALGDPAREARRAADEERDAAAQKAANEAKALKEAEAREIAAQEALVADLAAQEQAQEVADAKKKHKGK